MRNIDSNEQIFKYKGAIHVHSVYSDGTGDFYEIAKAAKKADLDWVIVTDHNNQNIKEGIIDGVTLIHGEEISAGDCNHYIALGLEQSIQPDNDIGKTTKAVRKSGGFGFAAHPDESLSRKNHHKPIR